MYFTWMCLMMVLTAGSAVSARQNRPLFPEIRADRHIPDQWSVLRIMGTDSSEAGAIAGHVYDAEGDSVIMRGYVEAWQADPGNPTDTDSLFWRGSAKVDLNGAYRISGLIPGEYIVFAHADMYEGQYYDHTESSEAATPVRVTSSETTGSIDFHLQPEKSGEGRLSGRVTDAESKEPVDSARVFVYNENYTHYFYTTTNANGEYLVKYIPEDTYYIEVLAEGYLNMYYNGASALSEADPVNVSENGVTSGIDFELMRGGIIRGTARDTQGNPLRDVYIGVIPDTGDSIDPGFRPWDSRYMRYGAAPDTNGVFEVTGLPEGVYRIRMEWYSSWAFSYVYYPGTMNWDEAESVQLPRAGEVNGVDFEWDFVEPSGAIEGRVTDAGGRPLRGAAIDVLARDTAYMFDRITSRTRTDTLGQYRLTGLPAGTYVVSCGYGSQWEYVYVYWRDVPDMAAADPVILADGETRTGIDFQLDIEYSNARIGGLVTADDGHPLMNATVQIRAAYPETDDHANYRYFWAYAVSDTHGVYSVQNLPEGEYRIECTYWEDDRMGHQWFDHADSENEASVIALGTDEVRNSVDFSLSVLPVYGDLAGTVTDVQGSPVQGACVEIQMVYHSGDAAPWCWWRTSMVTDEQGRYRVDRLYRGDYQIAVYANGAYAYFPDAIVPELAESVTVAGGETATADFCLRPALDFKGSVAGRVSPNWMYYGPEAGDSLIAGKGMIVNEGAASFVVTAKPAITVLSWPESERVYCAVTDSDGNYLLICPPGEYYLSASGSCFMKKYYDGVYDPAGASLITVTENTPVTGIDFKLEGMLLEAGGIRADDVAKGFRIFGVVTGPAGEGLSGVSVYVLNAGQNPVASVETDAQGRYQMTGLSGGQYYIQASKAGMGTVFNGNVRELALTEPLALVSGDMEVNLILGDISDVSQKSSVLPESVILEGNFPNPFNPWTEIRFTLPEAMPVTLCIYNATGQEVARLMDGPMPAGEHRITWHAGGKSGILAVSGIYFCRLQAGSEVQTRKMALIR